MMVVNIGAIVTFLRRRGFQVPFVPLFPVISMVLCVGLMSRLTVITWIPFGVWLALGIVVYLGYSRRRSESGQ